MVEVQAQRAGEVRVKTELKASIFNISYQLNECFAPVNQYFVIVLLVN